jgi:hypothetical protein
MRVSPIFTARDEVVAIVNGLRYFASVINGSSSLVIARRNMNATWRSVGTLCRERDWSKRRLLHELQHGLPYRTVPPGHVVDWHHPVAAQTLDLEKSEVTIIGALVDGTMAFDTIIVGIEVLPPTDETDDVLTASPASDLPAPPASPKNVSEAALRQCLLDIVDEHPDDPLDEETLIAELENRLGAPVARDRVRAARNTHAPNWVLPRGRPRKRGKNRG